MAPSQLRIYHGPEEQLADSHLSVKPSVRPCVSVAMSDVLPVLADAVSSRRAWLDDFENDEITISADLYEVVMAYQSFRPVA